MRICRPILVAALLAVATGCSPYDYSKAVGTLDGSAKALGDSVTTGRQQMASDVVATYRRSLIANRSAVTIARSCEEPIRVRLKVPRDDDPPEQSDKVTAAAAPRQPCDVYLAGDRGRPFADPFPVPTKLATAMKELTNYTGALGAVTNAKDRTDYNAAVADLGAAAGKIVAAAGGVGAAAGPAVTAAINLFGWLVGNALDIQRYESLKKAVNLVNTPVAEGQEKPFNILVIGIAELVDGVAQARREILNKDITSLKSSLGPGISEETYRSRLSDIQSMAATVDALNQSSAISAANALMKAHLQLVKAVNSPNPDLNSLMTALGDLESKVSTLRAALTAASTPAADAKSTSAAKKGT